MWTKFKADVELAAIVEIQAFCRMFRAKKTRKLLQLKLQEQQRTTGQQLCRYFGQLRISRRPASEDTTAEALMQEILRKRNALGLLDLALRRVVCRRSIWKWKEHQRRRRELEQKTKEVSVELIQRFDSLLILLPLL